MKKMVLILLLFVGLVSCWEDRIVELDLGEPRLYITTRTLTDGKTVQVYVRPASNEYQDSLQLFCEQTKTRLWVNDVEQTLHLRVRVDSIPGLMYYPYTCYFESDYMARTGDRIRFEAVHEGYERAVAETTVASPIPVIALGCECDLDTTRSSWNVNLRLTFRDKPGEANYYGLSAYQIMGDTAYWEGSTFYYGYLYVNEEGQYCSMGQLDTSEEPIIKFRPNTIDYILDEVYTSSYADFFDDADIDGEAYTLRLSYASLVGECSVYTPDSTYTFMPDSLRFCIELISYSQADYYHNISTWSARGYLTGAFQEIGLTDPSQVYSNVQGGTGLLGSSNITRSVVCFPNPLLKSKSDFFPERID